jgi:hypothetical protein
VPGSPLTLEVESSDDAGELARLVPLAAEALLPLGRWGGLREPTRIIVVPSHAALEERARRPGYAWLRAWGRYDVVYLQAPRTARPIPSLAELRDLLTHELTHCVMYQSVGPPDASKEERIPLWFREGLASWTAKQAAKRLSRETLARALTARPGLNPYANSEALLRTEEPVVYAASHWAFARLEQSGDDKVIELLTEMRHGATFSVAFAQVYGEEVTAFEASTLAELRSLGR